MSSWESKDIHDGWSFRKTELGGDQYVTVGDEFPAHSFPTTVHVELLKHNKIPHPFKGLHEWDVQWIGETEWEFNTKFRVSADEIKAANLDLVFDGLDTFATIVLNGIDLIETDNQFVSYRVPAKDVLKEGENDLAIQFESAFRKGRQLEKKHGKLHCWNGDSSRLYIRKAQYNYGWDWGPVLMTVGPWKPIRLEMYTTRIADVDIRSTVSEDLDATINVTFRATSNLKNIRTATVELFNPKQKLVDCKTDVRFDSDGIGKVKFEIASNKCQLWYPVGYGEQAKISSDNSELWDPDVKQPLYTVKITIENKDHEVLDTKSQKIGLRRVRVVEDPFKDEAGYSFVFEVNNIRIFCGGSNWIPADSFLTTMTHERYEKWLKLLVKGNQNMVRVWGGGIYEADDFYDICDELGILVWQDFMFGCGQYPAHDDFVNSVALEAEQNVKRLRHHPSVVIFAGNNEDYQLAESYQLQLDYQDETSDFRKTNFPARHIYERVLPKVVKDQSDIHYHRGSPYSGHAKVTIEQQHGDLHQWNVWHGTQEHWHKWDKLAGRFVSEFGMQAYPNIRTVNYWLDGNNAERFPQSRTMVNHNKADGFERRLELYLVENFRHAFDTESYVYYTQIMQAEALASAYRLWRRNWKGKGKEYTGGALVWQINDCWPVTSWAIVDYFQTPKPAYYAIKRELRPYTVGMTRTEETTYPDEQSAAHFTIKTMLEVWGTNSTESKKEVTLEVRRFHLNDPNDTKVILEKDVVLNPNSSTELFKGELDGQPARTTLSEVPKPVIISARLLEKGKSGSVLARCCSWPEPFKYLQFPDKKELGFTISVDGETVTLSTERPIHGIVLDVEGATTDLQSELLGATKATSIVWSDQAFKLVPGDPQTVKAVGLNGKKVVARFLGDGTA